MTAPPHVRLFAPTVADTERTLTRVQSASVSLARCYPTREVDPGVLWLSPRLKKIKVSRFRVLMKSAVTLVNFWSNQIICDLHLCMQMVSY